MNCSRLMRLNKTSAITNFEVLPALPPQPLCCAEPVPPQSVQSLSVAIIGLGGIGAVTAEMLTRSGVGKLWLIDRGTVDPVHLNRYGTIVVPHSGEDSEPAGCFTDQNTWGSPRRRPQKPHWCGALWGWLVE